jgi:hypothetical protein
LKEEDIMSISDVTLGTVFRCTACVVVAVSLAIPFFAVKYLVLTATLSLGVLVFVAAAAKTSKKREALLKPVLFLGVTQVLLGLLQESVLAPQFSELRAIAMYLGLGMLFVTLWEWARYLFPEGFARVDAHIAKEEKKAGQT